MLNEIENVDVTIPPRLTDQSIETISARELAKLLSLDPSTVYRATYSGRLRARRVGHRTIITREAALRWFLGETDGPEGGGSARAA